MNNTNSTNIEFEILYREFSFGNVRKCRIAANIVYNAMLRWSEDHKNDHFISIRYL
jgi:hypothetical protein